MSLTSGEGVPFTMPVQPAYSSGGNGGGMFGDNGWWVIVLFLIWGMWGGYGGFGGYGGGGGMNGAAAQGALTREQACIDNNFNNLMRETYSIGDSIKALNSTICNQQYDTARMINGLESTMQGGFNAANVVALQNQNALQAQIAQCCCDNREAITGLKYDMATSNCSIQTLINQLAQQIMWGQQSGIRDLTELITSKFCELKIDQKDDVIAELRTKLAACGDQTTAQYIINQLTGVINPRPVPAYPAASPCGLGNWAPQVVTNGFGYNQGCCNGYGIAA